MAKHARYLIDASVLMEAHRRYYRFGVCPGFWECLVWHHKQGVVFSIDRVKKEIDEGKDALRHWAKSNCPATFFVSTNSKEIGSSYGEIITWANAQNRYRPEALAEFAKREAFRDKLSGYVKVYSFLSQIVPYADPDLEMLYSYGRFLLPHLPFDRDATIVKVGDEVALQYYRLERVYAGPIDLREGDAAYVKSPTQVGTGRAKDEKAPLSEIIDVLNERFGTQFSEEDRLFFQQIKEKALKSEQVIQTAMANPLDKFELGIRKLIEELMIERMGDNDKIVTRYMADHEFQGSAFPILAREIFDAVRARAEEPSGSSDRI